MKRTSPPWIPPLLGCLLFLLVPMSHAGDFRKGGGAVEIGEADQGRTITLHLGQHLFLSLRANPTTGFTWKPVDQVDGLLQGLADPPVYQAERHAEGLMGRGGIEKFDFVAVEAGKGRLILEYRRPFELDKAPSRRVDFKLSILDSVSNGRSNGR